MFAVFDSLLCRSCRRDTSTLSQTADRAFGLFLEPSFGISFPTNPGPLAPIAEAAFAKYSNVELGNATSVRFKVCLPSTMVLPSKLWHVKPATAIVLKTGSPEADGAVLAKLVLPPSLAHTHCGYLIGSYWAPGVMNDDPAAMAEARAPLERDEDQMQRQTQHRENDADESLMHDVFLSIEGGGHVAIDWFRFE